MNQARFIGDFYLRGQFPDGNYDWRNYRTKLSLSGTHTPDYIAPDFRQETDTISRLVYGLATAYLLTGEDRFLEAAESGTEYLREHMRATNEAEGIVYWYHGIDVSGTSQRKIFTSEFGDDYDAIPMYEQIYALAGPTQTFRITGDPRILSDIEKTITLFDRFYKDPEKGGFFSHLDPINLDRAVRLAAVEPGPQELELRGRPRAGVPDQRGDRHRPQGPGGLPGRDRQHHRSSTSPTTCTAPSCRSASTRTGAHDRKWGWQQDSAVVGPQPEDRLEPHAHPPPAPQRGLRRTWPTRSPTPCRRSGSDQQRGGWYDVVERKLEPGQKWHRFIWHDRKAWWQQEQGILAYYILAGSLGNAEHARLARESAAFYNAHFLDHDEGGIYFNVLASGIPYLVGNERLKGSHSMSGYHSMELCYLAAVYSNLLVNEEDLELHFKPKAVNFPDGILRVAPDLLPPGQRAPGRGLDQRPPLRRLRRRRPHGQAPAQRGVPGEGADRLGHRQVRLPVPPGRRQGPGGHAGQARPRRGHQAPPRPRAGHRRPARSGSCSIVKDLETLSRQGMNELLFFRSKVAMGEDVYVVGACQQVAQMFIEIGDAEAAGGDFCRVDDESEIPA